MEPYVPTEVSVVHNGTTIKATSISVTRPRAEVVDVTGVGDDIGTRSHVTTGDKVGQATIQISGILDSGSTFATDIGTSGMLTISGPTITTISAESAILVAADEPIQLGQLRTVSLTFMVESI